MPQIPLRMTLYACAAHQIIFRATASSYCNEFLCPKNGISIHLNAFLFRLEREHFDKWRRSKCSWSGGGIGHSASAEFGAQNHYREHALSRHLGHLASGKSRAGLEFFAPIVKLLVGDGEHSGASSVRRTCRFALVRIASNVCSN